MPNRSHDATIVSMMASLASIPVFTASSPMSVTTDSIWAATVGAGIGCTALTPNEFCTVTAVTAVTAQQPCTPHPAKGAQVCRDAGTGVVPAIVITPISWQPSTPTA